MVITSATSALITSKQISIYKTASGVCKSCCTTEAIQATLLALQCFIKCKRNNNNANSIAVIVRKQKIGGWYSCLKLKPIYITYLNATPCLKPDEIGFMFDCCSVGRSIMFDCLSVRFTNVRMCSIGKIFRRVRLSSIPEPNRSQSNDWSSIGFDYRTFDQLGRLGTGTSMKIKLTSLF